LRANRRASWRRHVDSRLADMATATRGDGRWWREATAWGYGRRCEATGQRREATVWGDGAGRRRQEEARARLIYDAAVSHSTAGGGTDRRRWESCGGGAGGKWRARARGGVGFSAVVYSRASAEMPRAATDASHLTPRIVQTPARPKICAALPRIPRLLEDRFHLRARYTGGFFSACAL
jgi:hypothetical protein